LRWFHAHRPNDLRLLYGVKRYKNSVAKT
jgi:hypothetical protein